RDPPPLRRAASVRRRTRQARGAECVDRMIVAKAAKARVTEGKHAEAFALLRSSLRPEADFVTQARAASIFASIPRGALGLRPLRVAVLASSTVDHLVDVLRLWLAFCGLEAEVHVAAYD